MKKYYKILGLPLNASIEEVKNARNNLLKKYHPDFYQGSIGYAESKSAEINEAFEKITEYLSQNPKKIEQEKTFDERIKQQEEKLKEAKRKFEKEIVKQQKTENVASENKKKEGKSYLDITIYTLIAILALLVILYFSGVIK